jgi:hypothetical protein
MLFQFPPTPTPIPLPDPAQAPIQIDNIIQSYRIWQFADDAVGVWNRIGAAGTQVIQIAVIIVIVVLSMFLIMRFVRSLSNESESSS